ncbi:hypothetical protein PR001_g9532 [Phytophthora rubi]|uniref:Uncharacterized protein n=1 Tax=Phytophthora rubi TaxID=129364 RepID=A0A6A3N0M2_9STRA|nr:hypothetical protein PR001_g9532 [Phytophthora rubi]
MQATLPLPDSLTCRVFIRNGRAYGSGRNKVPPSPKFVFDVAEGYPVLRAKVENHFESVLPGQWSPELVIYFKPTNNAYQKDYQVLCNDNNAMQVQLETAWRKARLRSGGQAGFILELYIYVPKPAEQATSLRRATAARVQEQMPRVAEVLLRKLVIAAGPASQAYMAVTQARPPEGAPLVVSDNTTLRQLLHVTPSRLRWTNLKARSSSKHAKSTTSCASRSRTFQVNVSDLRAALGLPSYSLRPPFRAPTNVATRAPAVNMEDTYNLDA